MKRDTILIFEDNEIDRAILVELFQSEYKILEAANGKEGIALLNTHFASIAIVLLDNFMPEMDGFAVLEHVKEKNIPNKIPFIMITGETSTELEIKGYEYGIVSYITKPYQVDVVKQVVHNAIGWFQYKTQLEMMVKKQNINIQKQNSVLRQQTKKLNHVNEILIDSLSNIVEFRNMESKQHIKRIREYAMCLGKSVMKLYPEYELTPEKLVQIGWASSLHDIGKIAIPDSIILKPAKLTPDEFELIKSHTTKGAEIIQQRVQLNDRAIYEYAYDIARHHHEKYDGKGYPDGLKGDEISIAAQIVSLVDVYDALTSKRVYKIAVRFHRSFSKRLQRLNRGLNICLRCIGMRTDCAAIGGSQKEEKTCYSSITLNAPPVRRQKNGWTGTALLIRSVISWKTTLLTRN